MITVCLESYIIMKLKLLIVIVEIVHDNSHVTTENNNNQ